MSFTRLHSDLRMASFLLLLNSVLAGEYTLIAVAVSVDIWREYEVNVRVKENLLPSFTAGLLRTGA